MGSYALYTARVTCTHIGIIGSVCVVAGNDVPTQKITARHFQVENGMLYMSFTFTRAHACTYTCIHLYTHTHVQHLIYTHTRPYTH